MKLANLLELDWNEEITNSANNWRGMPLSTSYPDGATAAFRCGFRIPRWWGSSGGW